MEGLPLTDIHVCSFASLYEENWEATPALASCCKETRRANPWMIMMKHARISRLLNPLLGDDEDEEDSWDRWSPDKSEVLVE